MSLAQLFDGQGGFWKKLAKATYFAGQVAAGVLVGLAVLALTKVTYEGGTVWGAVMGGCLALAGTAVCHDYLKS